MYLKFYIFILVFLVTGVTYSQQNHFHLKVVPDTITAQTPQQMKIYVSFDSVALPKNTQIKLIFPKEFSQFAFDNNPVPPFTIFPTLQHGYCIIKGNRSSLH